MSDDSLMFADEEDLNSKPMGRKKYWDILIADDDEEIHDVTKMVLSGYTFEDRGINFIDAYSGKECLDVIRDNPNIAVVLLDVVMEHDNSGLDAAKAIREDLDNRNIRIILRTGQPGQAPELDVIKNYDINDYKEKTELTSKKLYTAITSSLRSYRDIKIIEKNKIGLEQIIKASSKFDETIKLKDFVSGILKQMVSLMDLEADSLYVQGSAFAVDENNGEFNILAGSGDYEDLKDQSLDKISDNLIKGKILKAFREEESKFYDDCYVGYFKSSNNIKYLLYLNGRSYFSKSDRELIQIFSENVSLAFEKINSKKAFLKAQNSMIYILGEAIELRSEGCSQHIRRVAEYSFVLALLYGLKEDDAQLIKLTSPLHDFGKIGIPEEILNKPSPLNDAEQAIIKTHPQIGYDKLSNTGSEILDIAATIALEHHENWDGTGYPNRVKGDKIHLFSRIVSVADIFDSLATDRPFRKGWSKEKILNYMSEQSGKKFDPQLVKLLIDNIGKFLMIKDQVDKESRVQ
jgi:response regulator RpfG family c-di-GMP phosphodiesterase